MSMKRAIKNMPTGPGVYLMKDENGTVLYVGKASNVRKRVFSYFRRSCQEAKNKALVERIRDIETIPTASEHEAFLLESRLIKRLAPRYNVSFKDDKSFPFIKITREDYPRVLIGRRKPEEWVDYFGPYTNVGMLRLALQSLRKIFPFCSCRRFLKNACLDYHLGLCCAPCMTKVSKRRYRKIIADFKHFLRKGSSSLVAQLEKRMQAATQRRRYEEALELRNRIVALGVLRQQSEIGIFDVVGLAKEPRRIEAFDISTLFGTESVGSMVTFIGGAPSKNNYRRFKIRGVAGIDDYRMLAEVIRRRYRRVVAERLDKPDLIIVDGGRGHLNVAWRALRSTGLTVPMIAIAKGQELIYTIKNKEPIALRHENRELQLIQRIRDEAHRFAVAYHHLLRAKKAVASIAGQ